MGIMVVGFTPHLTLGKVGRLPSPENTVHGAYKMILLLSSTYVYNTSDRSTSFY
jgi:hypothetical protein